MAENYDALIIGTGQAGPPLAARLAAEGWKVAIIERDRFGGTCVNEGCTPTKALVASARAARVARRAADYGVEISGSIAVNMADVKARKDRIVQRSTSNVEKWLRALANCTVYQGHARFDGPSTVEVGDSRLQADKIFVNVGTRPSVPSMPGLDAVDYLTSSRMMDVDFVPEHLVVIGGSYIGLEFGQMYRRFGSQVTIVQRGPRLIPRDDEDVSEAVGEILTNEGIDIRVNAECTAAERHGDGVRVRLDCDAGAPTVDGSHLLLAVGRRPNTDDLGLETTGVEVTERGTIVVDEQLRTAEPGIWALGDCNGRGAFTHTSYNDYEIVAANLLDGDTRRVRDRFLCYGLFIDPPLARVGMTETEVRRSGRPALVAKRPMTRVSRAIEKGETQGFMKIAVDAETEQILGAAILGIGGDESIHCIIDVMYAKAPFTVIKRAVHIHPTVSELIPTLLGDLEPLQ
ncbi:MAG TPA: FAD-containing oxidoreductase [Acidobacteriota bacterium]|nr:FAD-containing oxidoreductase [Acidobacteriota bacterium]